MNLDILHKHIGKSNKELDCLFPIYLLYPELPKYDINQDKTYVYESILKHCNKVDNLRLGDLILFKFLNGYHFGIYAGKGNFFHYLRHGNLRLTNLRRYIKYIEGYFRKW